MAVWLVGFLVLIAPFDIRELPILARLQILPFYGIIAFVCYMIMIPLQNWIFEKRSDWNVSLEISLIILFNIIVLIVNYYYYKSSIINGDSGLLDFAIQIYYPVFLILLPILLFSRWYLNNKLVAQGPEKIVLIGDNKLDILQLDLEDIVCVSSAENYVEVNYLVNQVLQKKLLRTTLKKLHLQVPELVKTHRSYLINPIHMKEWKDANTLVLTQKEVPVSKNYKNTLLALQGK